MVMQLDLAEIALLFKGALKQSEQQQGFCWENKSTHKKHKLCMSIFFC